jgi:NAD+ kinase
LVASPHNTEALRAAAQTAQWLADRGVTVRVETATARALDVPPTELAVALAEVDLVVVFGGDGSVVRAGRAAALPGVPVIGVNYGTFGFLAEIAPRDWCAGLEAVCAGQYEVECRLMLAAQVGADSHLAANDIAVRGTDPGRVLEMRVWAGDELLAELPADGLLVATPTGSTAYNLSAGGPVIMPEVPAMVMTPICAHTLATRPLVLPASAELAVEVLSLPRMSHSAVVSVDGQTHVELLPGARLLVRRAATSLRLARLRRHAFVASLRDKLGWGHPK